MQDHEHLLRAFLILDEGWRHPVVRQQACKGKPTFYMRTACPFDNPEGNSSDLISLDCHSNQSTQLWPPEHVRFVCHPKSGAYWIPPRFQFVTWPPISTLPCLKSKCSPGNFKELWFFFFKGKTLYFEFSPISNYNLSSFCCCWGFRYLPPNTLRFELKLFQTWYCWVCPTAHKSPGP